MRSDPESRPQPIALRWFALHVFALSGFALAQPVYSWVSAQQEFLVAHGADARAVLVLVLVLSLGLPFMVTGGTGLFRIVGRNALFYCQILVVGVLTGLVLLALPVAGVIGVLLLLAGAVTGGFSICGSAGFISC